MKTNNQLVNSGHLFLAMHDEVQEIKSDLQVKEKILYERMYRAFLEVVSIQIRVDSTVTYDNTGLEYKIVEVDLMPQTNPETKEVTLCPYVYLVRVKKGTKELLKAYNNGVNPKVYAKRVQAQMIRKIIIH